MFKRMAILIVLAGTFLGGYYVGRLPGSPDIFAMAQDGYHRAGELGKALQAATDSDGIKALEALTAPLAGQGRDASADHTPARPEVSGDVIID